MEKILKTNWWNKIFHPEILDEQYEKYVHFKNLDQAYKNIISHSIKNAKTFDELIDIHKFAWKIGYKNDNLNVSPYGMFRGPSVKDLNKENIFLGNVYGLWTNNITTWERFSDEDMNPNGFGIDPDTKVIDIMFQQYRNCLKNNIRSMNDQITVFLAAYLHTNPQDNPESLYEF